MPAVDEEGLLDNYITVYLNLENDKESSKLLSDVGSRKFPALALIDGSTGSFIKIRYFKTAEHLENSLYEAEYKFNSGVDLPTI